MYVFGNTPGKALFGLKVVSEGGEELSYLQKIWRSYKVMVFGLGMYVPVVSLIMGILQYDRVMRRGAASYDAGLYCVRQRKLNSMRKLVALIVWALCFLVLLFLNVFDRMQGG